MSEPAEPPALRLYQPGETPSAATNPAVAYVEGLAAGSRPAVVSTLKAILAEHGHPDADWTTFGWWTLRHGDTSNIRAALADRFAPTTTNRAMAVLRGVLREAWLAGLLDHEAMARATALPSVRGSRLPVGRHVETGEQRELFAACAQDRSLVGRRDAARVPRSERCPCRPGHGATWRSGWRHGWSRPGSRSWMTANRCSSAPGAVGT
ncbi:MAG: hypothetical protein M3Y91_17045 [Actinomycetota bacterium]|nr:hypothetical protein [Actinomycetota bacterium]